MSAPEVEAFEQALADDVLADLLAWVDDGSAVLGAAWDRLPGASDERLVEVLQAITRAEGLQAALAQLVRQVEKVLGDRHGRGPVVVDDVPICDVQRSAGSTKWNVEEAWPHLLARARDERPMDPDTGEVLEDGFATAFRVIKECCGISYLRVEALKERGLDPDDFRERGGWRWSVRLP